MLINFLSQIHRLVQQLPSPNQRMLEILLSHLANVVEKSDKNLMTVSNLGVCFGPTLFRAEEETVAAIMDIKFTNVVVEIMITHWESLLKTKPDTRPPPKPAHTGSTPTQVLPSSSFNCWLFKLHYRQLPRRLRHLQLYLLPPIFRHHHHRTTRLPHLCRYLQFSMLTLIIC